ncbi:MAG TPA: O-antigen ligase family protein [Bordetella sp.]
MRLSAPPFSADSGWQYLIVLCAIAVPSLALVVPGGANIGYFALAAAVFATCFASGRDAQRMAAPAGGIDLPAILPVSLALPSVAVLWTQLAHWDFDGQPMDAPSRFLLAVPLLYCLQRLPPSRLRRLRHVQWGLCAGAIGAALVLWVAPLDGSMRHVPKFASAITFGNLGLVMGLGAMLTLGWRLTRSFLEPLLKVVAVLAGFYASLLSGTRGGWVALPVLLILFLLLSRLRGAYKLLLCVLAVAILSGVYLTDKNVQMRIHTASAEYAAAVQAHGEEKSALAASDTSVGLRLSFWRAGYAMFLAHPFAGVGSQHIQEVYEDRAAHGLMPQDAGHFDHLHNDYLQSLAANGLPGLLARLMAYLVPLYLFVRAIRSAEPQRVTAGWVGALVVVSYMVFGLTETMFSITMNASFYTGLVLIFSVLALPARPGTTGWQA